MTAVPKGGTVAVTGAAGFIGGWVVQRLLDDGYRVRACVRDPADDAKVGFLRSMPGFASGRLTLHGADLDQDGCYDEVFRGCHGVAHVSHVSTYDDQDDVRRVCEHVSTSVTRSESVTRVVLTSSVAAVVSEVDINELVRRPVINEDRWPDEANPKRSPERGQGYSMGKVLAERHFADAADRAGTWDTITVCPADNVGPVLSAHQVGRGAWQSIVAAMLRGRYHQTGAYRPWMTVDVRDDAVCHVGLLANGEVRNGERYIAWSAERHDVEAIHDRIPVLLPELDLAPAELVDPFPERVQAREAELRAIWAQCDLRNDRIRARLDVDFRPFDETLRDCVESLLSIGGVEPQRRSA